MSNSEYEWDWAAQEVRNSDRSLWFRRSVQREGMNGHGVQSERYGIFECGFSVGFAASSKCDGSTQNPSTFLDGWERDEDGVAITQINGLTDVVRFNPVLGRQKELGPFQPTHRFFETLEQQERILVALPKMLKVLPESFNAQKLNEEKAGSRVGYRVSFSKGFVTARLSGALVK
ncbi:hypothetical protein [Pacificibacter marinus]|uniref:Uncharacterized protein n=1 Tax=Pacificibacter marinus TaxID=658057 RepID=A0A1Y5TRD5_9RHOB|nr:hypothetical protein [Pacificibacter marinus]SEK55300.1 hypothetical protein SAMN04488032_103291 [Pacificibacter marinus]SLN67946.1 hypothetical protein PAM7971_03606 [Pacificibacter marinus]